MVSHGYVRPICKQKHFGSTRVQVETCMAQMAQHKEQVETYKAKMAQHCEVQGVKLWTPGLAGSCPFEAASYRSCEISA